MEQVLIDQTKQNVLHKIDQIIKDLEKDGREYDTPIPLLIVVPMGTNIRVYNLQDNKFEGLDIDYSKLKHFREALF